LQKDHHLGLCGNIDIETCVPAAKVVGIEARVTVVGIELCEETLIVSLGIVASRAHEHHALLNGLAYRLGDWALFKNRFIEKSNVIHDDLRPGRREFLDCSNEIQARRKAGAEEQAGSWRQVSNDFCERPTLIASLRIRATILAIDDSDSGWQVAAINRCSWIAQTIGDDTHLHPFARHAKRRPCQIGTHHPIPFGRDTTRTPYAVCRQANIAHKGQSGHGLHGVRPHGRVHHIKLRIAAQHADTVLTQGIKLGWGQRRGIEIDFRGP
jgi:hypothetical protein